jgi:Leucine-rich repeat (LRR) protein
MFDVITLYAFNRNNHVSELPQELEACSRLSEVILSFNAFSEVPPVLYSMKSLETILASDNRVS